MRLSYRLLAWLVGTWCCCFGVGDLARGASATVVLSCTTNMSGYAYKRANGSYQAYFMSDPNAAPPALEPPYLRIGTEPGLNTNRIFLSFASSPLLKNTNISSVVLQFNVLDVANRNTGYQVRFHAFNSTTGTDWSAIWTDAGDGADYGSFNLVKRQGVNSFGLNAAAIADLTAAMRVGQGFELGVAADNRALALISGYYSSPPTLTVTYDCTPAVPSGLSANSLCGAVSLSWNPVPGALSYQVLRDGGVVGTPSGTTFRDTPGDCRVTHSYTVKAVNGCSVGSASDAVLAQVGCAPSAPKGVTASAGTCCDHIHLNWNGADGAATYGVMRDGYLVASITSTFYDDYPGNTSPHTYAVWASNSCGVSPSASATGYVGSTPTAPGSLSASPGTYGDRVELNWGVVPNAAAYQVWRSAGNNPGNASLVAGNVSGTSYEDCWSSRFVTNYYWVVATNACGASGFSPGAFGWASEPPAAPNVTATYGTYGDRIGVSWNAVAGASVYQVYRNTANAPAGATNLTSTMDISYTDTGVASCTPYWYWVQATNMSGAGSYSGSAAGLAGTVPAVPTGITASTNAYGGRVALNWSRASDATGYEVWRSSNTNQGAAQIGTTGTTNYNDDSALSCVSYWYWVKATNTCTSSDFSVVATGRAGPASPAGVCASKGTYSNQVSLTWTAVPRATQYEVWQSLTNDSSTASALSTSLTATNYTHAAVSLFVTNYYWVKAVTGCGTSGFSAADSGWAGVPPAAPTSLVASYGGFTNHIDVSWGTVPQADAYVVFRNTSTNWGGSATAVGVVSGASTYSDTNAARCLPYWYWVTATNCSGSSGACGPVRALAGVVPDAPTGLRATDAGSANGVGLSWDPVPEAVGYAVWRAPRDSSDGSTNWQLLVPFISGRIYQDAGAVVCTHYLYAVTVSNGCTTSELSAPVAGWVEAPPAAPTHVLASAGLHTRYVQVCWDPVPGATGYLVSTNGSDDFGGALLAAGTANSCYEDYAIAPGTTNYYWVVATNSCGQGCVSASSWGYLGTPVQITLQTVPDGLTLGVDGTNGKSPQTFSWEPTSCHPLSVPTPQEGTTGTRYQWNSWSEPALSNSVCAWSNATYTATFTPQHYLSLSVAGKGGGTVSPASGWYDETNLSLRAIPEAGFTFTGWTGTGSNAYSGMNNPLTVAMTDGPMTEVASFAYTNPCYYSLQPTQTLFAASGGAASVTVTTAGPCGWRFTNTCDWITILSYPTNCPDQEETVLTNVVGSCGTGQITYQVAANSATNSRFATLDIAGQSLTVTQLLACSYVLSSPSNNVASAACSGSFTLFAPGGCPWSASTLFNWIHTSSAGQGNGTVSYSVDANPSTSPRTGMISVGGQWFTVIQGCGCQYTLNPASANLGAALGSGSFLVSVNSSCPWAATTTNTWLHTTASGMGNGTVFYTADANTSTNARSGVIVVGGQAFPIHQAAACYYTLSSPGTNLCAAAASGSFRVAAGPGCAWTAVSGTTWIHTTSSGSSDGTVRFSVDANADAAARSGAISVQDQLFTIKQGGLATLVKGTYSGLFGDTNCLQQTNAGLLSASMTAKGAFSGRISVDGGSYGFHGQFDASGHTSVAVARRGKAALSLDLQVEGTNAWNGTVGSDDGAWAVPLHADRAVFGSGNPCSYVGTYTFMVPGSLDSTNLPCGYSFGTYKLKPNGSVTLAGKLADGVSISQGGSLSGDGRLPLFVSLYRGTGLLMGWLQFTADAGGSVGGSVGGQPVWSKPQTGQGIYPAGFNQSVTLSGLKYVAPISQEPLFDFTNGVLEVSGGNLGGALSFSFQVSPNNRVVLPTGSKLRLSLSPAAGKFSGSFPGLPSGKAAAFQGILVRPWKGGFGYFLGTNASGYVKLREEGP